MLISDHDEKFSKLENATDAQCYLINTTTGNLNVVRSGDTSRIPVLLIHGSPGSWDAWLDIMTNPALLEYYYFLSIDRPGYGMTQIAPFQTLEEQAQSLGPLLAGLSQPPIVIGHSYGGAVAQEIVLSEEHSIKCLIHVASTLEPSAHEPKWYNKIGNWRLAKFLLSDPWNASNYEMGGLENGLRRAEAKLPNLDISTFLIQGKQDILVPFSVVDYYKGMTKSKKVTYIIDDEQNHFIPWEKPELISEVLLSMVKNQ